MRLFRLVVTLLITASAAVFLDCRTKDPLRSQAAVPESWQTTLGGSLNDDGGGVVESEGTGYVIAGTINYDVALLAVSYSGQLLWQQVYPGSGQDYGRSLCHATGGGFMIAGSTNSKGHGGTDCYLIKADASGRFVWDTTYGNVNFDEGNQIIALSDGGYAVAGTNSDAAFGEPNMYLVKCSSNGVAEWDGGGSRNIVDQGFGVAQGADGGLLLVGFTYESPQLKMYMVKCTLDGSRQWDNVVPNPGSGQSYATEATDVVATPTLPDKGYLIVGYTDAIGSGGFDVHLRKIDSLGRERWTRTFGGPQDDKAHAVALTSDGGYVITGSTQSYGAGGWDVYLLKVDPLGLRVWEKTFGGANDDYGRDVIQASDGGYVVVGTSKSFGSSGDDIYIIKTDRDGEVQAGT